MPSRKEKGWQCFTKGDAGLGLGLVSSSIAPGISSSTARRTAARTAWRCRRTRTTKTATSYRTTPRGGPTSPTSCAQPLFLLSGSNPPLRGGVKKSIFRFFLDIKDSSRSPPRTTGTRRPCGRGLSVEEPPPRGDSPAPWRGSESELSFTANPSTRGFGRGSSTNQARDLKIKDFAVIVALDFFSSDQRKLVLFFSSKLRASRSRRATRARSDWQA